MCPSLHFQSFFVRVPEITVDGSQPNASAAISGNLVLRSLNPVNTFFQAQKGHPDPSLRVRSPTIEE